MSRYDLGYASGNGLYGYGETNRFSMEDTIKKWTKQFEPKPKTEPVSSPVVPRYEELTQSSKETADNTKGIKKSMDITDEDIKYLRDIAEQEAINKYTTAEIKIEVGDINNNVSNNVDLDGMIDNLSIRLNDAMAAGAEAVHQ